MAGAYRGQPSRVSLAGRRGGVAVVRLTLTDLDPLVSLRVHLELLDVERCFRDLKGCVVLRPMFRRKPERIGAHALICMLARRVVRSLQLRPGRTLGQRRKIFRPHRATRSEGPTSRQGQRPPWWEEAAVVLGLLGIAEVPTV